MKQDNLTEQAIAVIKKSIVSGEMKLGEAISELGICKKYNLSKTPVREALVILSHEELVNKVARKGCFVFDITLNEIEELAELRYLLEEFAAKKSLENNRTDLINDLQSIYSEMEIANNEKDYFKFLEIDTKFHTTFFKYSNNKHLIRNYDKISSKIQALRFYVVKKALEDGQALRSHKIMLDAIVNEDMEFFSENLHQHFISWLNKYKLDFKIGL